MDISALSVAMPTSQINTGLDYVVLSKALDTAQDTGDAWMYGHKVRHIQYQTKNQKELLLLVFIAISKKLVLYLFHCPVAYDDSQRELFL